MSVPQFGGWNQKAGVATDYSMVFSRARANRKQHKTELTRPSLGNEQELLAKQQTDDSVMVTHYSLQLFFFMQFFQFTTKLLSQQDLNLVLILGFCIPENQLI